MNNRIILRKLIPYLSIVCFILITDNSIAQERQNMLLRLPFDGNANAYDNKYIYPDFFHAKTRKDLTPFKYEKGVLGQAAELSWEKGYPGVMTLTRDKFSGQQGTLSLWVKQTRPFFLNRYVPNIWVAGFGGRLALVPLNNVRLASIKEDKKWHHFVYTWNRKTRERVQYLDGRLLKKGALTDSFQVADDAPMTHIWLLGYRLNGCMDEVVVLDRELGAKDVKKLYTTYKKGNQPFKQLPKGDTVVSPPTIAGISKQRPPLPSSVKWRLKEASRNFDAVSYSLGDYWRFQPGRITWTSSRKKEDGIDDMLDDKRKNATISDVPSGSLQRIAKLAEFDPMKWAYVKLPGNWLEIIESNDKKRPKYGEIFSQQWERIYAWDLKKLDTYPCAWLERDFRLPEDAKGPYYFLKVNKAVAMPVLPDIGEYSTVYINGTALGRIPFSGDGNFNLTPYLDKKGLNRLAIQNGCGYAGLSKAGVNEDIQLLNVTHPFLVIDGPVVLPSVRKQILNTFFKIVNLDGKPYSLKVQAVVSEWPSGKTVLSSTLEDVKLPASFDGEKELKVPVRELSFWSHEHPNLYQLQLLFKKDGKVIRQTEPVRFGYREAWVKDGRLLLNGKKLFIAGKSHNYLNYPFRKEELLKLKESGQNADRTTNLKSKQRFASLNVTDEVGWYVFLGIKPDREWLYKIGNHPSVIGYTCGYGNGYINGPHGHPMQIGGLVDDRVKSSDMNWVKTKQANETDPSRVFGYYRLGVGGNYRSIMHYLGFGVPVQTMEEWISNWAENRPAAFIPLEISLIPCTEFSLWQKGSGQAVIAEQSAKYFGEDAYRDLSAVDKIEELYAPSANNIDVTNGLNHTKLFYDLRKFVYKRALRAWRTYGIDGYLLHVIGKTNFTHDKGKLSPWGKTLAKLNAPILFYIAGPEDDFVSKDHHFSVGTRIRKSAVIINETMADRNFEVNWRLIDATGKTLISRKKTVTVKQGERCFVPITFDAPPVGVITDMSIKADCVGLAGKRTLSDEFKLRTFPKISFQVLKQKILLIDAEGSTRNLLQELRVPFKEISIDAIDRGMSQKNIQGYPLLIIGKNSYSTAAEIFAKWMPLDQCVKNGMNIVCLEQKNRQVMGLIVENHNSRRAFIRDTKAPLLKNLVNDDFRDWNGESDMLPAYLSWNPASDWKQGKASKQGQPNSFGQYRFWRWTNKGIVSTFSFEKPQVGNYRILLDEGFDLLYTPLIEFEMGNGRILLNQLDLVDHVQTDPVARLLFQRILQEYSSARKVPRQIVSCLNKNDQTLLNGLKLGSEIGLGKSRLLYLSPETLSGLKKRDEKEVQSFVKSGGTLVTSLLNPDYAKEMNTLLNKSKQKGDLAPKNLDTDDKGDDDIDTMLAAVEKDEKAGNLSKQIEALKQKAPTDKLPVKLKAQYRKSFNPAVPDCAPFRDLSMADFFWQQPTELPLITEIKGKKVVPTLGASIPCGKGQVVLIQIPADLFSKPDQAWQKSKINRIYTRVFDNVGAISTSTLNLKSIAGNGEDEEWLQGYSKKSYKRPVKMDKALYPVQALDFDPYQHHVW